MTIKELFSVCLKLLGIFFIKDILIAIPSFFGVFISLFDGTGETIIFTSILSLASIGIYCIVIYFLVFKTNWIISQLKLAEDFSQDTLRINLHRSSVLSIAIIFTGLFVVTQAIPGIIREIVEFINYRHASRGIWRNHLSTYGLFHTLLNLESA
jgi:hypothetical protein